jgi:hypothetical protein
LAQAAVRESTIMRLCDLWGSKRRHRCTHEERRDCLNVMPACLLGCDALFEKRRITVEHGKIIGQSGRARPAAVRDPVKRLDGKRLHGLTGRQSGHTISMHAKGSEQQAASRAE